METHIAGRFKLLPLYAYPAMVKFDFVLEMIGVEISDQPGCPRLVATTM